MKILTITVNGDRQARSIGINKDYTQWVGVNRPLRAKTPVRVNRLSAVGVESPSEVMANRPPKKEREKKNENKIILFRQIVELLNNEAGTNYKPTTKKTQMLIEARWNEGFRLNDFDFVIRRKCQEWNNTEMAKYLRPETLFGPKFESYLNQPTVKEAIPNDEHRVQAYQG